MRVVIMMLFVSLHLKGNCQKNIDGEFIFKTQLFLEKSSIVNVQGFDTKGEELMQFFNKNLKLKLDTLQSYGFSDSYFFLSLSLEGGMIYNDTAMKTDSSFFLFIENDCSRYVLAINKNNGKSYRLKGFSGNDFFNLYVDINRQKERLSLKKVSIKKFIKDYQVKEVDFNCLHEAMKSGEYDKLKYPCLKNCQVQNTVIH